MCPDSADNNDGQEEGCYYACDTVKDDHCHCGRWRFAQDVVVITATAAAINGILVHMYRGCWKWRIILLQSSHHCFGRVGAEHSVDVCKAEIICGAETAACGVYAVEHNCIGFIVHGKVDSPLRTDFRCIIAGFTTDERNVPGFKALNRPCIRQDEWSLRINCLFDSQWGEANSTRVWRTSSVLRVPWRPA